MTFNWYKIIGAAIVAFLVIINMVTIFKALFVLGMLLCILTILTYPVACILEDRMQRKYGIYPRDLPEYIWDTWRYLGCWFLLEDTQVEP